jgi:hypothetical protein
MLRREAPCCCHWEAEHQIIFNRCVRWRMGKKRCGAQAAAEMRYRVKLGLPATQAFHGFSSGSWLLAKSGL